MQDLVHLSLYRAPLVSNEDLQAWCHGEGLILDRILRIDDEAGERVAPRDAAAALLVTYMLLAAARAASASGLVTIWLSALV